jgi:hypothetical protein
LVLERRVGPPKGWTADAAGSPKTDCERRQLVHLSLHKEEPMETCMSITVVDETTSEVHDEAYLFGQQGGARTAGQERLTWAGRPTTVTAQRTVRYADAGIQVVDDRMRLPSFDETCPHVSDKIIPLNGGRFNVDHYLRVLRAKAEIDVSIAMALPVRL